MARTERARRLAAIEAAAQRHKAQAELEVAEVEIDLEAMALIEQIVGPRRVHDNDDHERQQRYPYWNAG